MCEGFGVVCERVTKREDVRPALERMLASDEAHVVEVMVPYTEHVLPMIPGGMTYKDVITKRIGKDFNPAANQHIPTAL